MLASIVKENFRIIDLNFNITRKLRDLKYLYSQDFDKQFWQFTILKEFIHNEGWK